MRFKLSLQPYLVLAFLMLVTPFVTKAATFNFNSLYKGSGTGYVDQTQQITNLANISGSGFQFYQAGTQFSGNNINGILSYTDNSGNAVTIYGKMTRLDQINGNTYSFYVAKYTDATYTSLSGEAYLLIVPGKESQYSAGANVSTSSNFSAADLNAVVNTMPTATLSVSTLSGFTACPNTASTAQSFTLTASNLSANIIVSAPTGYLISGTQSGTYSSTLTLTPTSGSVGSGTGAISNGIVWVELYSSTVGSNSGKISVASTGAGTQYISLTGTIANVVGGTISGSTTIASATNSTTLTLSGNTGTIQWQSSTDNITYSDITGATTSTYLATNITATTYYRAVITNNACTANSNIATITYDNGCYSFDINDFTKNGNATDLGTGVVRLTQATNNQNGSIWNKNKVNLDYDFDISSKINLGSSDAGADGIAFVLQNYAVNAGSTGGGLGYQGITPSFAVEFDTYYNGGADPGTGADHIALVKNGLAANLAAHSEFANPYFVEMEDNSFHDVRFVWTASTKNFKVYWNGSNTPLFDITVDLKTTIFNGKSNVFFGFTAATGGAVNIQQVQVPTYCLVKQVSITPKPGTNNTDGATTFCSPGDVVLEASSNASYVWYKDGVVIPNATSKTITVSESGIYKVDGVNFQGNTTTSDNLTVTSSPPVNAGTISSTNSSVCSGGSNTTTISLTGSVGSIQWQRSTNGTTFTNITGATSATYTATNLTVSTYYRAVVTSGNCGSVNSGTATITVSQCIVANPDVNATNVNTEVAGNVSTNDVIASGTNYGTPSPLSTNPSLANITIDAATGNYSFTATKPGKYQYYVPVCGVGQTSNCQLTLLQITVLDPTIANNPPVANADLATSNLNTPVTTNVLTNDKSGNIGTVLVPSSVSVVTQPLNGAAVANSDGTITYTPTNGFSGTDSLVYTVCDNGSPSNCQSTFVYYTILSAGAKSVTSAIDDYAYVNNNKIGNASVSGNVLSNDKNTSGSALTASLVTGPTAAQGVLTLNADGSFTFVPTLGFSGPIDIIYNACTGDNPAICSKATLHIVVSPPPTINPDFNSTNINVPVLGSINTNDVVPAGTTYGTPFGSENNPSGATISVNATTGTYTFTAIKPGKYIFNVPVCAASQTTGCPISPLQITVLDPSKTNNPPVANNDYSVTQLNTPVVTTILANDKPGNQNTQLVISSIVINTAPKNGTAVANKSNSNSASNLGSNTTIKSFATNGGTITYTPNTGFVGLDSLIYTVCDDANPANCEVATVYYTISTTTPNNVLVANDDYNTAINRAAATGNVLLNDDYGGAVLKASIVTGPTTAQGSFDLSTDGTYSFTPAFGYTGPVDIIYQACSGTTCINATLHILVNLVPPPPPTVINATYVAGSKSNPTNIKSLVSVTPIGTTLKWCDPAGNVCTSTPPVIPNLPGTYIWCVKSVDTVTQLSSDCAMDTVIILAPYTVMEVTKSARSIKTNPDGSVLLTFVLKATNKTNAILDSVSIKDDLTQTFNTTSGFTVASLDVFGGLIKNSAYDGVSSVDLVTNKSKIAANSSDSAILKILVASPNIFGNLTNTATLGGKTKFGYVSVNSNDPLLNPSDSTKRIPTGFNVPKVDLIIAGGFSPNFDGLNDKWIIVRPFGTRVEVQVFNRWGNIVYQNADYKNDWTGKGESNFMGEDVPDGTYFYIVNAIDPTGAIKKFTSSLTIVR